MLYTFREAATIYTTVEANSEAEAWAALDKIEYSIPDCMDIDVHDCQIQDIWSMNGKQKNLIELKKENQNA